MVLTREEWVRVALARLPRAALRLRYASIRQLEMKVSESGPQRPNPIHVERRQRQASRTHGLLRDDNAALQKHVQCLPHIPRGFSLDDPADAARRTEVLELYVDFMRALHEDGGKTLERAVFKAALQARAAGSYAAVIGSLERPPDQAVVINGVAIERRA